MHSDVQWGGHVCSVFVSWWMPPPANNRQCIRTVSVNINSFPKWFYPVLSFKKQVRAIGLKRKQEFSSNAQCIVKIGCYWFSHVHEFKILPWVYLAYSCLKFPAIVECNTLPFLNFFLLNTVLHWRSTVKFPYPINSCSWSLI